MCRIAMLNYAARLPSMQAIGHYSIYIKTGTALRIVNVTLMYCVHRKRN